MQMMSNQAQQQAQMLALSSAPSMIGDFPGYFGTTCVAVRSQLTASIPRVIQPPPIVIVIPPVLGTSGQILVPGQTITRPQAPVIVPGAPQPIGEIQEQICFQTLTLSRGAFKISENESPVPQDRFFATYNYFHQIPVPMTRASGTLTQFATSPLIAAGPGPFPLQPTLGATLSGTGPGTTTLTDVTTSPVNLHRETIGFEKTLLDGRASIGLRLPFLQTDQQNSASVNAGRLGGFTPFQPTLDGVGIVSGFDGSGVGDLTIVTKYAFIREENWVASGGLVVTAPTGGGIPLADGSRMYSTLLQPYLGAIRYFDRWFVHGFTAIAVPTDDRDLTALFNDIGVGYNLYRNDSGLVTFITPTLEAHVTTPVDNGGDGIKGIDLTALTGGMHFGIGPRSVLTMAMATPVTGPRPYQVEAIVQLNWRY